MPYFEPLRFVGERKAQDCKRVVGFQNLRRRLYAVDKKPRVRKGLYGYIEYRLRVQDANRCGECGIGCCGRGKKARALQVIRPARGSRFNHIFQYLNLAGTAANSRRDPEQAILWRRPVRFPYHTTYPAFVCKFHSAHIRRCLYYTLSLCFRLRGVCVSPKREMNKMFFAECDEMRKK